jgi:hypothetical protein
MTDKPLNTFGVDEKNKVVKPKAQKVIFGDMESAEEIAKPLIKEHHPHLLTAIIKYRCRSKSTKRSGNPVPGNVMKVADRIHDLVNADFLVEVALDVWNDLNPKQRIALIDHLLTRLTGIEDEDSGEMRWNVQPPIVQEFPEVVARNGNWNDGLIDLEHSMR